MSNIIDLTRKRLMDTIKAVQPVGKWKIIVVDSKSSQIINAACRMYDILEENVTLVENIERKRQPYPSLEAIYILTPCLDSICRLVDDFSIQPMYKAAHVHFTSNLSDTLFAELNQKLKSSGISDYVVGLKELYVDFMVSEASVFTVDYSPLGSFFGCEQALTDTRIRHTAKQLLSVFATLGQDPTIRYPLDSPVARQLAFAVQKEMDHFCSINPSFPPPQPKATLLVLDRSVDCAAPILHEFTYQAMLNDLLPVKATENKVGIQYTYHFHQSDGTLESQEVTLDEEDSVYQSVRHMHIAQCSDHLIENFNQFLADNKVSGERENKSTAKNLKEMKQMLTNLPQFQNMKSKFSAHLNIAQECMSFFERQKLNSVGNLEQNMATFETADGETPKTVLLDMVPLLGDPQIGKAVWIKHVC
ncbi:Sec1-like protein [Sporodiniella umbellata]|nr:Sec1-like protein [Sporodiniella umbellata]